MIARFEVEGAGRVTDMSSIVYSHGVRRLTLGAVRQVMRLAAYAYLAAGVAVLEASVVAGDFTTHLRLYAAHGIFSIVFGVGLILTALWVPDDPLERRYSVFGPPLLLGSTVIIATGLYCGGNDVAGVGTGLFLLPVIVAGYALSRRLAMVTIGASSIGYAGILMIQPDVPARFAQWLFLTLMLFVTASVLGRFIESLDELAVSEHHAHAELTSVNASLADQVRDQVQELERYSGLRRFLAPQVADALLDAGAVGALEPHRREIAVFFCDLRGFTHFAGRVEPEDVLDVLNTYYDAVGDVVRAFSATVGHFAGDGVMAYFNDPVPCADPAGTAVQMALQLRERLDGLASEWSDRGYRVGYGMGIALGHATLGMIGFEGRYDYTPVGSVVNLAARLCSAAAPAQILVDDRVRAAVLRAHDVTHVEGLTLDGFETDLRVYALERSA